MMRSACLLGLALTAGIAGGCSGANTPARGEHAAPGADRSTTTRALESGANVLQAKAPVEAISMYLDGFHVAKDDPTHQMEAHHYCNQVNEDFAQCVLFDGTDAGARMTGIEYIVSETLYAKLPADERAYWHPHNYEILSGQLQMPGVPAAAEHEAMKRKINSYGKTWHTWMAGVHGRQADALPIGPARLQWSANRDGEISAEMLLARDRRANLDTTKAREQRQDLVALARPQGGVDVLAHAFATSSPLAGVTDNGDTATRPVPALCLHDAAVDTAAPFGPPAPMSLVVAKAARLLSAR